MASLEQNLVSSYLQHVALFPIGVFYHVPKLSVCSYFVKSFQSRLNVGFCQMSFLQIRARYPINWYPKITSSPVLGYPYPHTVHSSICWPHSLPHRHRLSPVWRLCVRARVYVHTAREGLWTCWGQRNAHFQKASPLHALGHWAVPVFWRWSRISLWNWINLMDLFLFLLGMVEMAILGQLYNWSILNFSLLESVSRGCIFQENYLSYPDFYLNWVVILYIILFIESRRTHSSSEVYCHLCSYWGKAHRP